MKNSDYIDSVLVQQKIDIVNSILKDLSSNYDFHYTFSHALLNKSKKISLRGFETNPTINLILLNEFINQMLSTKEEQETVMLAIASGNLVVICIDDENQSKQTANPLIKNRFYLVDEVISNQEEHYYILRGMNPGNGDIGYNTKRFLQLFNSYSKN